jgi:hypothetical protein
MTNTSKGEGSQHQTKKHIERDLLLVRIRFEYPLTTDSTIRNACLSRRSIRSLRLSREVAFSVSSPAGWIWAGKLPIIPFSGNYDNDAQYWRRSWRVPTPDGQELTRLAETVSTHYTRNSTIPVSRLYIAPAIFMLPVDSRSRSTGLFSRMSAMVVDTFVRATASTKA